MSRLAANLIRVSKRDTQRAVRVFRQAERATLTAEKRVLLRAGNNVRSMSIAALRGRKSRRTGLPAMPPLDKAWRGLLRPEAKMGGILADKQRWRISMPNSHARDVDIAPGLQPLLERWEFGDQTRPEKLRAFAFALMGTPEGRAQYHRSFARRPGWPADPRMLPPVQTQPVRNFRDGVAAYADAHMGEWFCKIWQSCTKRG